MISATKTSPAGLEKIEAREGKVLHAYFDSRRIPTIGVGHTGRMSPPPVRMGDVITDEQCLAYLASDVAPVERALNRALLVPVTQNEYDAMVSLGFNVGAGGLAKSLVVRRVNAGDIPGAAAAFRDWAHPAELLGRRNDEARQFLEPDGTKDAVTSARAAALETRAHAASTKSRASSRAAGAAGGAAIVAGSVIASSTHSHPAVLIVAVVAAVVIAAGIAGTVLFSRHAATLTAGAKAQGISK